MSTTEWVAEMGDISFDGVELFDHLIPPPLSAPFHDDFLQSYSDDGFPPYTTAMDSRCNAATVSSTKPEHPEVPQLCCERIPQQSKPEAASLSDMGCFGNSNLKESRGLGRSVQPANHKGSPKGISPHYKPPDTKEHVIAERKRRAKLSQQFIALTAIVPGIKKIDKATVLDDTIKYMKHLQEREKILEEQKSKKTIESAVFVKKFHMHSGSDDENMDDELLPQIEARVSDRNVLIRILCEKRERVLVKAIEETEKLNLRVVNCGVMPFGHSTLDITLLCQMDGGFMITVKDVVRSLRSSWIQFMAENLPRETDN